MAKTIYLFGKDIAEGNAAMSSILGGKGANLAEMCGLGLPVPPGFTISAHECEKFYKNNQVKNMVINNKVKSFGTVLKNVLQIIVMKQCKFNNNANTLTDT